VGRDWMICYTLIESTENEINTYEKSEQPEGFKTSPFKPAFLFLLFNFLLFIY
jgi:hypothetical protein